MAQLEGLKEIEFGPLVPSGASNIKNQSDNLHTQKFDDSTDIFSQNEMP